MIVFADVPVEQVDEDLATQLRRLLATQNCPKYIRDVAPEWLRRRAPEAVPAP